MNCYISIDLNGFFQPAQTSYYEYVELKDLKKGDYIDLSFLGYPLYHGIPSAYIYKGELSANIYEFIEFRGHKIEMYKLHRTKGILHRMDLDSKMKVRKYNLKYHFGDRISCQGYAHLNIYSFQIKSIKFNETNNQILYEGEGPHCECLEATNENSSPTLYQSIINYIYKSGFN